MGRRWRNGHTCLGTYLAAEEGEAGRAHPGTRHSSMPRPFPAPVEGGKQQWDLPSAGQGQGSPHPGTATRARGEREGKPPQLYKTAG